MRLSWLIDSNIDQAVALRLPNEKKYLNLWNIDDYFSGTEEVVTLGFNILGTERRSKTGIHFRILNRKSNAN